VTARFCPGCGQPLAAADAFCPRCGSPVAAGPPAPPGAGVTPGGHPAARPLPGPAARARPRRTMVVIVVAIVVALVLILALFLVPIRRSFGFTESSSGAFSGVQSEDFPSGSQVSGHWTTSNGVSVTLDIDFGFFDQVYSESGTAGSFSFTTGSGTCLFLVSSSAGTNTTVTGTVNGPLL
jgi:hypothetical protein